MKVFFCISGEFSTQTCFQGRFGAETGSDQYGAHILAHAPEMDTQAAVVRLSYIEISHAGQAFRMGRWEAFSACLRGGTVVLFEHK